MIPPLSDPLGLEAIELNLKYLEDVQHFALAGNVLMLRDQKEDAQKHIVCALTQAILSTTFTPEGIIAVWADALAGELWVEWAGHRYSASLRRGGELRFMTTPPLEVRRTLQEDSSELLKRYSRLRWCALRYASLRPGALLDLAEQNYS